MPGRLMDSFYWMARLEQNGFYASVADWLHDLDGGELPWALHPFLEFPEWRKDNLERVEMPEVYSEVYSTSKLWRVRRGSMSATVTAGLSTPFGLKYGSAELRAVKLCASYFGTSQFVGETFEKVDGGVRLRHPGKGWVYDSPGYFHPVGRPVEQEALREVRSQRKFTPVPPLVIDLDVREVKGGFDLYATTPEGMDGVPFQIECVFEPGGEFDFEGGAMRALEGQTVFLKSGTGVYHQGRHAISIGPGAGTHRMWQMHNSEKSPDGFRVLVTLVTPVDRVLEVRYGTWSTAEEGMVSDL